MGQLRLNIGGAKGNAVYIIKMLQQFIVDREEYLKVQQRMIRMRYNEILREFIKITGVELYSHKEIGGVDKELYTLIENPEYIEL